MTSSTTARIEIVRVHEGDEFPLNWDDQVLEIARDDMYDEAIAAYKTSYEVTIVRRGS